MSNMSYCRFQNTLDDLRDCLENWDDPSSDEEIRARDSMLRVCEEIVGWYSEKYEEVSA